MSPLAALLAAALAADPQAQIAAARARRAAEEAAAQALAKREASVLGALDEAQRSRFEAERELARAEAERSRAESSAERARVAERKAAERLDAAMARLGPRLAARARMGSAGGLRVLLASASASDLARRRYYLERVLERDAALLEEARAGRAQRESARREQERETARLSALADEASRRREDAAQKAAQQHALLAAIRGERSLHERAAAEAAAQERRLGQLVAALSPSPPPGGASGGAPPPTGFAALRGRLSRPADGPVVAGFGRVVDPRFNTVTNHPGVDIRAAQGAPVRAVAAGRVVHAGWFRGYGNLVIVDHGDGFHTLVAHLGTMSTAVGEDVGVGSLLGTVGDSGTARGAYVYFEIRDRQRPVDPSAWLAPTRGDMVAR